MVNWLNRENKSKFYKERLSKCNSKGCNDSNSTCNSQDNRDNMDSHSYCSSDGIVTNDEVIEGNDNKMTSSNNLPLIK